MKRDLHRRLTIEFVLLFVLLYFFGGAVAIFMFATQLDRSIDNQLQSLTAEVLPAVDETPGGPSLKRWGARAQSTHSKMPFSIQVFDQLGILLEEFGPVGHRSLSSGVVRVDGPEPTSVDDINLRSYHIEIRDGNRLCGYLQVQVSVRQRDDALKQIVLTMVSLSPFLALAVAICGSWFAGKAVKPVEETMELLRQFVADAAHEINTPITVIEASVQTLEAAFEDTFEDTQIGGNVLAIINRASGRMKALGQSLVVLSRMESPDHPAPIDHITVESLAAPVLAECEQLAHAKDIKLTSQTIPEVTVLGNSESLERMLLNLIANAIRYTDEGGAVQVSYEVADDRLTIIIEDNGIGIPPESLPHIFQRFYRVDKSRSRNIGGFGLGLAIVKAVVDRHNGEITVKSQVGKGSLFSVSLRRAN